MAWSEISWFWLVLFGLFTILVQVPGSQGSEYCESYWDKRGNRHSQFWCEHDCCGSYNDRHCCDEIDDTSAVGAVIGGIISIIIIGVIVCLIVCCCVAACPLHKSSYRGRVLGWGQDVSGPVVTTTTSPVVMGQTQTNYVTTPAQPGVVAHLQPQAAAYPTQYQQQYPQPVAPPAYSEVAGPPPQYPPSVVTQPPLQGAAQPPVQSAPPSAPPSDHVYEKLSG